MKRVLLVAFLLLAGCGGGKSSSSSSPPPTNAGTAIPGVTSPPPWPAPQVDVSARAESAGLPMLPQEALNEHIHAHLDVFYNGQPVVVPQYIGIDLIAEAISPLHTHDTSGIVHIESPVKKDYFLGQFFTEWGVAMANGCVAGVCQVAAYVNGTKSPIPPEQIVFHAHDEVVLVVGTPPTGPLPTTYQFPTGY